MRQHSETVPEGDANKGDETVQKTIIASNSSKKSLTTEQESGKEGQKVDDY